MVFKITAFGIDGELDDDEKEKLARHVHDYIHEEFGVPVEGVDIVE